GLPLFQFISDSNYTEKYCINIDKPELECDGKCHLEEELREASQDGDSREQSTLPVFRVENHLEPETNAASFPNYALADIAPTGHISSSYSSMSMELTPPPPELI
ncbi:MAG: hypothetical protein GY861_08070, partial [bacterium]|nr:hypothetical protein [bacterium]